MRERERVSVQGRCNESAKSSYSNSPQELPLSQAIARRSDPTNRFQSLHQRFYTYVYYTHRVDKVLQTLPRRLSPSSPPAASRSPETHSLVRLIKLKPINIYLCSKLFDKNIRTSLVFF